MTPHRLTLPVLLTATFMGFLDSFIVIVAVPSIADELQVSIADTQLVLSIYVVTYGAALVIGGRLGDRFGRRTVFGLGMGAFTLSSLGCALAPDLEVLVVMRALQGIAAALMLAQVLATIQAVYEGEARRRAVLAYTTVLGAAATLGQLIGGGLLALDVAGTGWRALFAVNVPIGVAALVLVNRTIPQTRARGPVPIDVLGGVVLAAALIPLLLGLGLGPDRDWPVLAWVLIVLGAVVGVLLPFVERRAVAPLLSGQLLRQRPVRLGLVATLAFYAGNSATLLGLTLFLQDGLGIDALGAGIAYLPLGLAYLVSTLAGRRSGAPSGPQAMLWGSLVMFVGLAAAIIAGLAGAGPVVVSLLLAGFGAGMGFVYPAIVASVLARVRPGDEGAASGVLLTTTQIANAVGFAVVTAAWNATESLAASLGIATVLLLGVAAVGTRMRAGVKDRSQLSEDPQSATRALHATTINHKE
ncbi:MFS transporter [Prauserella cavernicola]|uniref:MFS transporter n=1 Tax=Prauserella cavernicola TaxID=2800127 RepID=A0A934V6X9_9PSEU|nr:MFS transporter [Prauserella cavernicola]MBK1787149.1 MFS transporter [Prauserella cavernicola]